MKKNIKQKLNKTIKPINKIDNSSNKIEINIFDMCKIRRKKP